MDLSNPAPEQTVLESHRPDIVISSAPAFNFVDLAETEPEPAFAVDALAVHHLAPGRAHEIGCRFVHFSSDYVFGADAKRATPFHVTDAPEPLGVYGAVSWPAKPLALNACPATLVVRTCGLYGLHGTGGKKGNFVETMLRLAHTGKAIRVVDDQQCTPSYTV